MRPKMHALLLDATINSALTLRLNIYQVRVRTLSVCLHAFVQQLAAVPCQELTRLTNLHSLIVERCRVCVQ
jgi:hypothetical protein